MIAVYTQEFNCQHPNPLNEELQVILQSWSYARTPLVEPVSGSRIMPHKEHRQRNALARQRYYFQALFDPDWGLIHLRNSDSLHFCWRKLKCWHSLNRCVSILFRSYLNDKETVPQKTSRLNASSATRTFGPAVKVSAAPIESHEKTSPDCRLPSHLRSAGVRPNRTQPAQLSCGQL